MHIILRSILLYRCQHKSLYFDHCAKCAAMVLSASRGRIRNEVRATEQAEEVEQATAAPRRRHTVGQIHQKCKETSNLFLTHVGLQQWTLWALLDSKITILMRRSKRPLQRHNATTQQATSTKNIKKPLVYFLLISVCSLLYGLGTPKHATATQYARSTKNIK